MACPHWGSGETSRRRRRTARGSRTSACRACRRTFNERTGTPVNALQYSTDIVLLAVLWRLRYTLSFRDVAALLLERGFGVTHETIREWECRFAPLWADRLRAKRRGSAGVSGSIDETSVQVAGRWCALDRARDRDGDLLDSMRSEHRDQHAARFCTAFDELRPYFRVRQRPGGPVPLVDKRQLFLTRWRSRIAEMTAVSTSRSWGTRCPALCVV